MVKSLILPFDNIEDFEWIGITTIGRHLNNTKLLCRVFQSLELASTEFLIFLMESIERTAQFVVTVLSCWPDVNRLNSNYLICIKMKKTLLNLGFIRKRENFDAKNTQLTHRLFAQKFQF